MEKKCAKTIKIVNQKEKIIKLQKEKKKYTEKLRRKLNKKKKKSKKRY